MISLSAYVNHNGVFITKVDGNRYFLQKYTFGKEGFVRVRITVKEYEALELCSNFRDSWDLAHKFMVQKLAEKARKKKEKYQGNC